MQSSHAFMGRVAGMLAALAVSGVAAVPPAAAEEYAAPAAPAPTAEVIVSLRDGSFFRGTLIEKIPGDHLTLQLSTGDTRRIAWSDIAAEAAASPMPPAPVSPPMMAPMAAPPPMDTARYIGVQLQSPDPMTGLYELSNSGRVQVGWSSIEVNNWSLVCNAPCNKRVSPDSIYSVGGTGIQRSDSFRLSAPPGGGTLLTVVPRSPGRSIGGRIMTITGAALVVLAPVFIYAGSAIASTSDPTLNSLNASTRSTFFAAGAISGIAGAGLLAGGIVLLATRKTRVTTEGGERLASYYPLGVGSLALSSRGLVF